MTKTVASRKIRMAQYGTKHAHAAGVLSVMLANPDVEVIGLYEPDVGRRRELASFAEAPWSQVRWLDDKAEMLEDDTVVAISSEGSNLESLDHTEEIVAAGKHVFYDKPAGADYPRFEAVVASARQKGLLVQLGYMFRYNDGFTRIAEWARAGFLGDVFAVRGHMSTNIPVERQDPSLTPAGGIFYDLAPHMVDQIVWILGRPSRVTSFLREDVIETRGFPNNTLGVFEYHGAMAIVDIAAMEPAPTARRFEVYGSVGSAIMEPMEPADTLRLALTEPRGGYPAGVSIVDLEARPRYVASLEAFVKDIRGEKQPDRSLDHELLVQETILRATGHIAGS
jgi:predicted dehydrogenase